MYNKLIIFFLLFLPLTIYTQPTQDWYLQNPTKSEFNGIGVEEAYEKYLKDKQSTTIVVAVIDSGVDVDHEDLDDVIWTNVDELPDNGKDDDQNGYIDDVHGWNFIGGPDGKNVNKETLEMTRLYRKYREKYKDADTKKLSRKEKKEYDLFVKYGEIIKKKRAKAQEEVDNLSFTQDLILNALSSAKEAAGDVLINDSLIEKLESTEEEDLNTAAKILNSLIDQEPSVSEMKIQELYEIIEKDFSEVIEENRVDLDYTYNPDYDSRSEIVKDDYGNSEEKSYGNNDMKGEFSFHGTHVSGIIAAERKNDQGIDGIADNVRIMSIRTVPDGDERDKDVANAIRYAVDNGASVINMSFGKGQSWDKKVVDKAVKYAAKNDVLLVHAAGNSGALNDGENNYPNAGYEKRGIFGPKKAKNWIEVGALNYEKGTNSIAGFSNYGKDQVDLFAPGVAIYSTTPNNGYQFAQGTSMASPVVAGTAALIRSYFPGLTAVQVKDIIVRSTTPIKGKVIKPGTFEKVNASDISISGGMLNAEQAINLARGTKGKKAVKNQTPKT